MQPARRGAGHSGGVSSAWLGPADVLPAGFGPGFRPWRRTLSDPQVDSYNLRVGTQTFSGLYKFTTNTLLVETANAITNMGSDTIKMYMGPGYFGATAVTAQSQHHQPDDAGAE